MTMLTMDSIKKIIELLLFLTNQFLSIILSKSVIKIFNQGAIKVTNFCNIKLSGKMNRLIFTLCALVVLAGVATAKSVTNGYRYPEDVLLYDEIVWVEPDSNGKAKYDVTHSTVSKMLNSSLHM